MSTRTPLGELANGVSNDNNATYHIWVGLKKLIDAQTDLSTKRRWCRTANEIADNHGLKVAPLKPFTSNAPDVALRAQVIGRIASEQTEQSRGHVTQERSLLGDFNDSVGRLVKLYRVWADSEGRSASSLSGLWEALVQVDRDSTRLVPMLYAHRPRGGGSRFHLSTGFILNLPLAFFRYKIQPMLRLTSPLEPSAFHSVYPDDELKDALSTLCIYYAAATDNHVKGKRPGEVDIPHRDSWMRKQGWGTIPHWINRVEEPEFGDGESLGSRGEDE